MFSSRFLIWDVVKISRANVLNRTCGLLRPTMHSSSTSLKERKEHKIEEDFVTVGSRKIKYVRTGRGAHTVLCCPGALGSAWTDFKHQISGLDLDKLTLVVWDPPGYGQSRPPGKDLEPGFILRDARVAYGLMEALSCSHFSVLGWSAGSFIAIGLGALYPENINKLVIWGGLTYISAQDVQVLESIRDINVWPETLKSQYVEFYGVDGFRTMWVEWIDTLIRFNRGNEGGDVCLSQVKQISCPLLILHGEKDPVVSIHHAHYVHRIVPGAELYVFKNGKHNIHVQYHEEFNSVVMDFLLKPQGISNNRLGKQKNSFKNKLLVTRPSHAHPNANI